MIYTYFRRQESIISGHFRRHTVMFFCLVQGKERYRFEHSASSSPSHAETSLQIVNICDDICHLCSNRNGWSCTSLRPSIFDVLVSGRYNILPGKEYTWKTLLSMLPPLSLELLEECCPNCQWLSLCRQIVSEEPPVSTRPVK